MATRLEDENRRWAVLVHLYYHYSFFKDHAGSLAPLFYAPVRLWECGLHTLINTLPFESKLQYLV